MSVVLQTGVMRYRENENDSWHPLIIKADMNLEALIDEYDATATKTWVAGELCSHDGLIYSCKSGITTPKAWTAGDWDLTDFGEEISKLKEKVGSAVLTTTAQNLSDGVNELKTKVGSAVLTTTAQNLSDGVNELKTSLNQLDADKAEKTDLVGNIILSGVNTTGQTITKGTYFYNNGTLVRAIADISGSPAGTITAQNTETVTAGGLNAFKYHIKTYTLSAASDERSPLGYYVSEDISADVSLYGEVITVFASDVWGYPAFGTFTSNGRINITAKRAGNCSVTVTFLKGINQ